MIRGKHKYFVSRLACQMKDKGIKNLTELAVLTGYNQNQLERILISEIEFTDIETIEGLKDFFKCRMTNLIDKAEKFHDYTNLIKYDSRTNGIVYFARDEDGLTKIGWTQNFKKRKETLEQLEKKKIELVHYISSYDCITLEKTLHNVFKDKRITGEWFDLSDEDIELVKA